jgi:serine/threonine-protein phosphatase CPPED1
MKCKKNIKTGLIVLFLVFGMVIAAGRSGIDTKKEAFTFVQISDTQLGYGGYEHDVAAFRKAVASINNLKPDFVVFCGDFVDNFTAKSIADFNQVKSGLTMPCYLSPGNHEMFYQPTVSQLTLYRKIFGKDYFSVKHKGYTIVIVNSQLWKSPLAGESVKYDTWFKKTLKEAKDANSPVFVVQHIPVFIKEPNEPEDPDYNLPVKKRAELLALMKDCGVVAVLGGHKHQTIINNYKGIQLVNTSSMSKNDDNSPLGFRLWRVNSPTSITHEFIQVEQAVKDPNILILTK